MIQSQFLLILEVIQYMLVQRLSVLIANGIKMANVNWSNLRFQADIYLPGISCRTQIKVQFIVLLEY